MGNSQKETRGRKDTKLSRMFQQVFARCHGCLSEGCLAIEVILQLSVMVMAELTQRNS